MCRGGATTTPRARVPPGQEPPQRGPAHPSPGRGPCSRTRERAPTARGPSTTQTEASEDAFKNGYACLAPVKGGAAHVAPGPGWPQGTAGVTENVAGATVPNGWSRARIVRTRPKAPSLPAALRGLSHSPGVSAVGWHFGSIGPGTPEGASSQPRGTGRGRRHVPPWPGPPSGPQHLTPGESCCGAAGSAWIPLRRGAGRSGAGGAQGMD